MRKITLFLSLCLAFIGITGTAQPQDGTDITDLSNLQNGKTYWLQSARDNGGKYLLYDISSGAAYLKSNYGSGLTTWTRDDDDCWKFAIYKSDNEKYYIYSLSADKFIGYASINNGNVPLVTYPTNDIKIKKIATVDGFPFVLSTDDHGHINMAKEGTHGVVNWADAGQFLDDTGSAFKITEAGDLSAEMLSTIESRVKAAEAGLAVVANSRYNVKVNGSYLSNRPDDNSINQLKAFANANNSKAGKAVLQLEPTNLNYVYKIKYQQNQLEEEYTYLVYSSPTGNADNGVQVLTQDNQQYADNDQWFLRPVDNNMTFMIRPYREGTDWNTNGSHWNLWGGTAPAKIGLWGNESQANNVVFEVADITADQAKAALPGYLSEYINGVDFSRWTETIHIGYAPASAIDQAKADAANAASLYECMNILNDVNYAIHPDPEKYYTIRNAKVTDEYLVENYDLPQEGQYSLYSSTLQNSAINALWKFERMTDPGKTHFYHIKNVNSNLYMSKSAWEYKMRLLPAEGEIGEFNIFAKSWVDVDGSVNLWDPTHDGTAKVNDDGTVTTWKMKGYENVFFIEEATEIPVTIGFTGYATLNLPFAVTVAEGVKAHTAVDAGATIELKEIGGDVIPANTPVILIGSPNPYKFAIVYEDAEATQDAAETMQENALSGTTVPETIDADAKAYILKAYGNEVAMCLVNSEDDRTIPANKAYLGSTQAAVEVKRFAFAGEATGIEGVTTNDAAADIYYDLNGRRVLYPAHGVYVKSNGQKVLIK